VLSRLLAVFLSLAVLYACTDDDPVVVAPPPSPEVTESVESRPTSRPPRLRRDRRIKTDVPHRPRPLARRLVELRRELLANVERWVAAGSDPKSRLGRRVALESVTLQRLMRSLVADSELARKVRMELPAWLRAYAARHIELGARLRALVSPVKRPVELETSRPLAPRTLLRIFRRAARRYGVNWHILAAINFVETRFGRIVGPSSAGALGPMQFLPSTWERYGNGGDIRDPRDAVPAAARLLREAGSAGNMRGALLAYNNSDAYADAVLTYANDMREDPRTYYVYWCWEVFVITTKGDVQLTGRGAERG
jgi:soluble lytic murein transglycosylase-like protein